MASHAAHAGHVRNWNPMMVFWLGLLTGALVVGFVFLYRLINTVDYQDALLKYTYSTSLKLSSPISIIDSGM